MLRLVFERDTWSYPAARRLEHAKLLDSESKPPEEPEQVIVDFTGGSPVWEVPAPTSGRKLAMFFEHRDEDPLWATSQ